MSAINSTPDHLHDRVTDLDNDTVRYFDENPVWLDSLDWVGKLSFKEQTLFRIYYSGTTDDYGIIMNDDDTPLVIWAEPVGENLKIVLFDERIHGYNALLVETLNYSSAKSNQYNDKEGRSEFNIFMWTNSSVDFEDEFELNEDREIYTLENQYRSLAYLKRNAFDYLGILIRNENQEETVLLDMELA
ncbi:MULTISPECIES: hypothetical protein [unclassified Sphingobacterium]|uniref:hypothetical protein n=1 Tax=unclassified Sphingobacterium TaxID=2609468 RepID=UPI0025DE6C4D|nr:MULTISPECIES: hypothetical protein [unclassified Sphingobacterium]